MTRSAQRASAPHWIGTAAFVLAASLLAWRSPCRGQEGMFLSEEEAPHAVFPDADRIERSDIVATEALREKMRAHLGSTAPSIWEPRYPTFTAWHGDVLLGRAFLVEEIGKHRPITFVVGIRPDGSVEDVAVVAYREAYGGEIRHQRFLAQYRKKGPGDSLQPGSAIANIAGATLSVQAASRAVKKAMALAEATAAPASPPATAAPVAP